MLIDDKRQALTRALVGGAFGIACCLLVAWLTQPGGLFGHLTFDFTFCYNHKVPQLLGAALGLLLWFLFGAETGIATLPFADGGRALLLRSLAHFGVMSATMWAWVLLNFPYNLLSELALSFQLPFTLVYILVWLGRWVGWYAEVAQIRERLGLAPKPSFLKWRETLPHIAFAAFLCLLVPTLLRLCDAPDVPVLSGLLYPYALLPIAGFCSALSLGRRQGFCPLYPLSCLLFILLYSLSAHLYTSIDEIVMPPIILCILLLGNLVGAGMKVGRERN